MMMYWLAMIFFIICEVYINFDKLNVLEYIVAILLVALLFIAVFLLIFVSKDDFNECLKEIRNKLFIFKNNRKYSNKCKYFKKHKGCEFVGGIFCDFKDCQLLKEEENKNG